MSNADPKSVVVVQYAGDYGRTYRELNTGGPETYYAQRYSIDVVAALVTPTTSVTTICCVADSEEDTVLSNGVRAISMRAHDGVDERRVWDAVHRCVPTHLCLRTPLAGVLGKALREDSIKSVLLTLADSFNGADLRARLRAWKLRRLMNHPKVAAVGNHGVNSSESLRRLGVDAGRIIPWDWPHEISPHQASPKEARADSAWNLLFVGALAESKGLGDVMRAMRLLKDAGIAIKLSYAGRGDTVKFAGLAKELGIEDRVDHLGMVAHSEVVPLMRGADLIVIPSRHEYPEGFPMTIYEALSSRTPIIASDHPMYARHLSDTRSALVYPAGNQKALAQAIRTAMSDPHLYRMLSLASAGAWDKLQLPVTWGRLLGSWLDQRPGSPFELSKYALAPT